MVIHEMTADQCRDVLSRSTFARLACARANQPYIVPVSLAYHKKTQSLFGVSPVGKKITWMRRNPRVCVEVEDVADRFHWTTLVITGRFEEIPPTAEFRDLRQEGLNLFRRRSEWWLPALSKVGAREQQTLVVYRILIDGMTGRRASRASADASTR
jgi:nitroimidazol reductase NimA-like FMN-containing flavoprotein (pyridoxamine 5'-phosphate oxidase superfamily)